MKVCLIGNPNCGKTTLFNSLTGTYQKVGNFTGVTVERKDGVFKNDKSVKITDLPGLYSLTSESLDERTVLKFLKESEVDVIINILDGTNLYRNLRLTCELTKLNIKTVIAVNYFDELYKNGIKLDEKYLESLFGVPVVKISALKNLNLDILTDKLKDAKIPNKIDGDYYGFIDMHIDKIITRKQTRSEIITQKVDEILTHKYFGIPIFFAVLTFVYFLSYSVGNALGGYVEKFFSDFSLHTQNSLMTLNAKGWVISLVSAVFSGFTVVISFLPQILILFFLMTIVEESGYSSRGAFMFDRLFRRVGLGGKSLIPLMLSCGCSVTGIMSARTIEDRRERIATVYLAPFMPCSAKTAVFGWFSATFFGGNPFVASSMYILSIISVGVFGRILAGKEKGDGGFILEMPTYRLPTLKDIFMVLINKTRDFTVKAGTVIFAVSVLLWILRNYGFYGYTGGDIQKSFLYLAGNGIKYIFYPLGFCSWETSVAVITGLLAKEAVIETLTALSVNPATLFNGVSAYSFMAFILLMPPCIASLSVARKELGNIKDFFLMIVFQTAVAYTVSLIINLTGKLFFFSNGLILSGIVAIIILTTFVFAIKKVAKKGCDKCTNCKERKALCEKK